MERPKIIANIDIIISGFDVDFGGNPEEEMSKVHDKAKELVEEIEKLLNSHNLTVETGKLGVGIAIPKSILGGMNDDKPSFNVPKLDFGNN